MFGGLAFMLNGHMCCGIVGDDFPPRHVDKYISSYDINRCRPCLGSPLSYPLIWETVHGHDIFVPDTRLSLRILVGRGRARH